MVRLARSETQPGDALIDETERLEPHPLAFVVDRPTEEQYQGLKASVVSIGRFVNPEITRYEERCLDGNSRLRVGRELGLTDLLVIREFDPAIDGDPVEYVQAQNEHRRHLSDDQRSETDRRAAAATAFRDQGLTYLEIAERLGISEPTARRLVRVGTPKGGQNPQPSRRDGSESPGQGLAIDPLMSGDDVSGISDDQGPTSTQTITTKRGQSRPKKYDTEKPRTTSKPGTPRRKTAARKASPEPVPVQRRRTGSDNPEPEVIEPEPDPNEVHPVKGASSPAPTSEPNGEEPADQPVRRQPKVSPFPTHYQSMDKMTEAIENFMDKVQIYVDALRNVRIPENRRGPFRDQRDLMDALLED
jgi:ParB-like chromosome segregation protein Spo0J